MKKDDCVKLKEDFQGLSKGTKGKVVEASKKGKRHSKVKFYTDNKKKIEPVEVDDSILIKVTFEKGNYIKLKEAFEDLPKGTRGQIVSELDNHFYEVRFYNEQAITIKTITVSEAILKRVELQKGDGVTLKKDFNGIPKETEGKIVSECNDISCKVHFYNEDGENIATTEVPVSILKKVTDNKKAYLFYVYKILLEQSNEDNKLTQEKIVDIMGKEPYVIECERKAVGACIQTLKKLGEEFNFEIVEPKRGKGVYYKVSEPEFELSDIALLYDSVLQSRIISQKETEHLAEMLRSLLVYSDRKKLPRVNTEKTQIKLDQTGTLYNSGALQEAIESGWQVEFDYCRYNKHKNRISIGKYQVSPLRLMFNNGFYLLLCQDNEGDIRAFRVDMMKGVKHLENIPADTSYFEAHTELEAEAYVEGHPYMQVGKIEPIDIIINEADIGRAIDTFGKTIHIKETEQEGKLHIWFNANLEDVYIWALQNADGADVIFPQSLRNRLRKASYEMNNRYLSSAVDRAHLNYDNLEAGRDIEERRIQHGSYIVRQKQISVSDVELQKLLAKNNAEDLIEGIFVDTVVPNMGKVFAKYPNIYTMTIRAHDITDISFLEEFQSLTAVDFNFHVFRGERRDSIKDYSPIAKCEQLEELTLFGCSLSDADFLSSLKSLKMLRLCHTAIKNIDFVKELPELRSLEVVGNDIEDLSALYSIPTLTVLKVDPETSLKLDIVRLNEYNPTLYIDVRGSHIPPVKHKSPSKNISGINRSIKELKKSKS